MKTLLSKHFIICASCLFLFSTQLYAADITIEKNNQSGLLIWTAQDNGFSIELIQLSPDFVRAIYGKQDFPSAEIERIAAYCVFGTVIKNTSQHQLTYKVRDWTYIDKNKKTHPVKTKTQWLKEWRDAGINFSWTLLPDENTFDVGDWQQGFTTIALPRNSHFDLNYQWTLDGSTHTGTMPNISCAPETLNTP